MVSTAAESVAIVSTVVAVSTIAESVAVESAPSPVLLELQAATDIEIAKAKKPNLNEFFIV